MMRQNLILEEMAMKKVTTAILVATLIIFAGCGNKDKSAEEKAPAPPSVGLHVAAIQGNLDAVLQHIEAGSDLNEKEPSRGSSPLITAAAFDRTEIAVALIEAGADVNYRNNEGSTALHTAALFCRTEIVKALLENGADKTISNNAGRIPMDAVAGPFEDVKGIYDRLGASLKPLGLTLDYERIKETRPKIAEMLQ
jgi:ankyrin repeat protein